MANIKRILKYYLSALAWRKLTFFFSFTFDTVEIVGSREPSPGLERQHTLVLRHMVNNLDGSLLLHPEGTDDDVVDHAVDVVPSVSLTWVK